MAERADDLLAGADQPALRQVVAEQVDRRDERLRLERKQAGRAREVVAVGLGVDLDLVALQLGVEDVGAAAEVDDVQQLDVVAQLESAREVELVGHLGDRGSFSPALAASISMPGEGHQAGEALGPDRGLRAAVRGAAGAGELRAGTLPRGARRLELAAVALGEQVEPLGHLAGELGRLEHRRVARASAGPRPRAGARTRSRSRRPRPCRGRDSPFAGLPSFAVGAEVALDQPGDPVADEDPRRALVRRRAATRSGGRSRGGRSPRAALKSCSALEA